jgi:hypothetical protein
MVKIGSTLHDFLTEYRNIVSIIVVECEVNINARNLNILYRG